MYCVHTLNTKKIHSNLTSLNTFIKETSSPNVKLSKVGSNAIVLAPVGAGPTKTYITPADPEATEQKREKKLNKSLMFFPAPCFVFVCKEIQTSVVGFFNF